MPTVIQDASGYVFRDVQEYDLKTGSVTRYLTNPDGTRQIDPVTKTTITVRSRRPRPLTVLQDGLTVAR